MLAGSVLDTYFAKQLNKQEILNVSLPVFVRLVSLHCIASSHNLDSEMPSFLIGSLCIDAS